MTVIDLIVAIFIVAGLFFFFAGTVGLLRFPDIYTRLHALTKADNLGLGLIIFGLSIHTMNGWLALKLLLIWILVMYAGSTVAQMISGFARKTGIKQWKS